MLDAEGYRPNVGIILLNGRNEVFWGKRIRKPAWQFPQGGIDEGETPEDALMRELSEEIGLAAGDVEVLARTKDWLYYDVPLPFRRADRSNYKGQKQIWYLLKLKADAAKINLNTFRQPEFDDWRWNAYWVPIRDVIGFKQEVYRAALIELAPFVFGKDSPLATPSQGWLLYGF